ncbi:MAG: MYXO-CTERM sorting domain-containing protein, partial [Polyangiales bacterium]
RDLAYAARGAMQLTSAVPAGIPELEIAAVAPTQNSAPDEVRETEAAAQESATRVAESLDAGGCGCRIGADELPPLSLALLGAALLFRSRRRKR